jgi:xanthine/CO dehydrogenase XdhC/CoxF family maturation factor
MDVLQIARDFAERGERFALATVVWRRAPSSGKTGYRAVITAGGEVRGWVGGACAEPVVVREALAALEEGVPRLVFLGTPEELAAAEQEAEDDERGLEAYRSGRACHPLLPYADWAGCAPARSRLGQVLVAGSRDAVAARALGFVPSHGIGSALDMAHGVAGGRAHVGILLAPPYAPLLVG